MNTPYLTLCKTKDDKPVYYDPLRSHTATHFEDTPQLKALVIKALASQTPGSDQYIPLVVDLHRTIGTSDLVDVTGTDEIMYAIRKNREEDGYVPFTKTKKAQECSTVAMWLTPLKGGYELLSAWIGTIDDMPFPQHPDATPASKAFWRTHALVWGSQSVIPGSETTVCPW